MELRHLAYFVHVVEAGSFSAAAVALNLAQPTLSRQISALERELQQPLLTRTGRGVKPTEAGVALLAHARAMLDIAERAKDELRDLQSSPTGKIAVGLPPRISLAVSDILVSRFRERMPRAELSISEGLSVNLREWLLSGRLDIALLFDPPGTPALGFETLLQEELLLVAPMSGATLPRRVSLDALAQYPLILPSAPSSIRSVIDAEVRPRGIKPQVLAEVGTVSTVMKMVSQGMGYTILPDTVIRTLGSGYQLRKVRLGPPMLRNTLKLAVPRSGPMSRLVRETLQLLRDLKFG
ncbi:MAG: LysR family transcriptional regulator [Burkholderiaceae bacterium]